MPDLGPRRQLNIRGAGTPNPAPQSAPSAQHATRAESSIDKLSRQAAQSSEAVHGATEEEDEVISAVTTRTTNKNTHMMFLVCGILMVVFVVFAYLMFFKPHAEEPKPGEATSSKLAESPDELSDTAISTQKGINGVGAQDFSQDTTMKADRNLSQPDSMLQDIYGMKVPVDYTATDIQYATDFASYSKKRGTWGGGLELYWLDASYKNHKYVIQVPFKYYKELDQVGIVPVKMEVLRLTSDTGEEQPTVISYMVLDEATLQTVLDSQNAE